MKECLKCKEKKLFSEFTIKSKRKDGCSYRCKKCTSDDWYIKKYGYVPNNSVDNLKGEVWKTIPSFGRAYEVSNFGRVKKLVGQYNTNREKISNKTVSTEEYYSISILGKKQYLHRLVAEAFIPNPYNKPIVNHKNGNKKDFRVENLEWVTNQENCTHASETGLLRRGETHPLSKLNEKIVSEILKDYKENPNFSKKDSAKKHEISIGTIYKIITKRSWTHVQIS